MKKMIINIALFLIMGVTAMACKKEENTTNGKSYVRFTMDDTEYVFDFAPPGATGTYCQYSVEEEGIVITGAKPNGSIYSTILIYLEGSAPTVGQTYDLSASYAKGWYYPNALDITNPYSISSGTLTISKVKSIGDGDYAVNGTFSGVAEDISGGLHTITNGTFYDVRTE